MPAKDARTGRHYELLAKPIKHIKQDHTQKRLMFFLRAAAILLIPSEMVTKEKPRKSPRQPPNSASKEVKG